MGRARALTAIAVSIALLSPVTAWAQEESRGLLPPEPTSGGATPAPGRKTPKIELPDNLSDVEVRLNQLDVRIKRRERAYQESQLQLAEMSGAVREERGTLKEVRANLTATRRRYRTAEATVADLRRQLNGRARSLYKRGGPLELIGVLVDAGSMRDFVGRVGYAAEVADKDQNLLTRTRIEQDGLTQVKIHQRTLEQEQQSTVLSLKERRDAIADVFARQQAVLTDLASDRAAVLFIADQLTGRVSQSVISGLRLVAGMGMTITYDEWARQLLEALGAPIEPNNIVSVVAWQAAEGTQATWNPLATTMPGDGATQFNDVGVRNFPTLEDGIDATIATLSRGGHGYERILDALQRAAPPEETARWIQQSNWCRGCAEGGYVVSIVGAVQRYYDKSSTTPD